MRHLERAQAHRVVGVVGAEPSTLAWLPLQPIFELAPDEHLWSVELDKRLVWGAARPADELELHVREGLATKLPEPIEMCGPVCLVRLADGSYSVKSVGEVADDRQRFYLRTLERALKSYPDDVLALMAHLDRASWAERVPQLGPIPPIASACRVGYAVERENSGDADGWTAMVLAGFKEDPSRLDLELVTKTLSWERLAARDQREHWLANVESLLLRQRPRRWPQLKPTSTDLRRRAARLLSLRDARPDDYSTLGLLPHHRLRQLLAADEGEVTSVHTQLAVTVGVKRDQLDAWLVDRLKEVDLDRRTAEYEDRMTTFDLYRLAVARSQLETDLGNVNRWERWRRALLDLPAMRSLPHTLKPWQAGEEAANTARACWVFKMDERILAARRLAEDRVGLIPIATKFHGEAYDSCHITDPDVPPVSFLDIGCARNPAAQRFSLWTGVGLTVFGLERERPWLCRRADDGPTPRPIQAARAFAAYFLAPRGGVVNEVRAEALESPTTYQEAAQKVARRFGLSLSAAWRHVANCHDKSPRQNWLRDLFAGRQPSSFDEPLDGEFKDEPIDPAEPPPNTEIPIERANGFTDLLATAVRREILSVNEALEYTGDNSAAARKYLESRIYPYRQ